MVRCGGCRAVIRLENMTQPDVIGVCKAGDYHHIAITSKSMAPFYADVVPRTQFAITEPA